VGSLSRDAIEKTRGCCDTMVVRGVLRVALVSVFAVARCGLRDDDESVLVGGGEPCCGTRTTKLRGVGHELLNKGVAPPSLIVVLFIGGARKLVSRRVVLCCATTLACLSYAGCVVPFFSFFPRVESEMQRKSDIPGRSLRVHSD
jgi:hypothetical protein